MDLKYISARDWPAGVKQVCSLCEASLDAEGSASGTDGLSSLSNQFLMQYHQHQEAWASFSRCIFINSMNIHGCTLPVRAHTEGVKPTVFI